MYTSDMPLYYMRYLLRWLLFNKVIRIRQKCMPSLHIVSSWI